MAKKYVSITITIKNAQKIPIAILDIAITVLQIKHALCMIMAIVMITTVGLVMETVMMVNVKKISSADIIIFIKFIQS